jgi:hypothetical protein
MTDSKGKYNEITQRENNDGFVFLIKILNMFQGTG